MPNSPRTDDAYLKLAAGSIAGIATHGRVWARAARRAWCRNELTRLVGTARAGVAHIGAVVVVLMLPGTFPGQALL